MPVWRRQFKLSNSNENIPANLWKISSAQKYELEKKQKYTVHIISGIKTYSNFIRIYVIQPIGITNSVYIDVNFPVHKNET